MARHLEALLIVGLLGGGTTIAWSQTAGAGMPAAFRAYFADAGVHVAAYQPQVALPAPREAFDRHVFKATRKLEGSPRWTLAQADSGKGILKAFSCPAGATLTDKNVPALVGLLSRYRTDLINATRIPPADAIPRPYQRFGGPTCIVDKPLAMAGTTPTIQSAWGWTVGLILSGALPARTDSLMRRARSYGESAAICGFASASEVETGRYLGSALYARARASAEFSADLERAGQEIAAAAASSPTPQGCDADAALAAPAY